MTNKLGIKILLIIGLAIAGAGVYMAHTNIQKSFSYEKAEGVITGFHTHEDDPYDYHANITFPYKGDSVSRQLGHYDQNFTIGQNIVVSFPPDEPDKAEIKTSVWFGAALLLLIGISWLATMWFIWYLQQKTKAIPNPRAKLTSSNSGLPLLLLFSLLAIILSGLAIVFIGAKLNNPESSTEWGGLIALALLAFIFLAVVSGGWRALWLKSNSINVEADFVRVTTPELSVGATGKVTYKWKIECEWNDPKTGKKIMFTSEPFEGGETWYNRNKIQVLVYLKKPEAFYTIDLTFISSINQSGIVLVDEKTMAMVREAEEKLKQEQNIKIEP